MRVRELLEAVHEGERSTKESDPRKGRLKMICAGERCCPLVAGDKLFRDKTLNYGRPPCHTAPIFQLEPSSTGMNYANILTVSVQCLSVG
ncbi:hypothetical protein NQZ68_028756 [Dissostichus eleginoides]|nr:hypothetical protein NQZ68_028756 [Dissostichus eleginoides]